MESSGVGEADALETNRVLHGQPLLPGRAGKDCRLQPQEVIQILNEEQASVDLARAFQEGPKQHLALLEGLEAEQEVPQPDLSGESPVQHPAQARQAAAPGQEPGSQLGYGSLPHQAQPPFP